MKDREEIGTPEEPAEPEEPDEPSQPEKSCTSEEKQERKKREKKKKKEKHPLEIYLEQANDVTKGGLNIYRISGGRSIQGKSGEDFVQDGFLNYLEHEKVSEIDIKDIAVQKAIIDYIRQALPEALRNREIKFVTLKASVDDLADPNPPQQRKPSEDEIDTILVMLFDMLREGLSSNEKRGWDAVAKESVPAMMQCSIPEHKEILKSLVDHGCLNQDYSRMDKSLNLCRPAQLREKLPQEYRAFSNKIYHILKGDKFAKNRYLAATLKITYRNARILYNKIRRNFENFITREFQSKKGILSNLSDADKMEILRKLGKKI